MVTVQESITRAIVGENKMCAAAIVARDAKHGTRVAQFELQQKIRP